MKLNKTIFRKYDIRGIVDKDLTEDFAYNLAKGFSTYILKNNPNAETVSVGFDARLSSPDFAKAMSKGFNESGLDVILLGMVPTPLLYFSLHTLNVNAGVMITGSHNPPEYNGFKLCMGKFSIYGEEIKKIAGLIEKEQFTKNKKLGETKNHNIIPDYSKYVKNNIKIKNPEKLKVVIDSGNGVGGFVAVPIMKSLGLNVISLYEEPDGTFPNHHPDPTVKEYVQELIKKVKEEKADLGIGYDGDADRIGVISNTGEMLKGDQVLHIFARSILKENPGAIIVGEVKCSQTLYDDINKKGGKAVMWKTGHSLIKAKMREIEALLGGEMSGHIFFKHRWFGFDDAIYSSLRFLEILSESKNKDVEKLLHDIPKVHSTHEIKIKVEDETKFKIIEQIIHELKEEGHEVIDIDGARVIFTDGWGLIRCSNTTPYIMMRFEAETKERLDEIQEMFHKKVKKFV